MRTNSPSSKRAGASPKPSPCAPWRMRSKNGREEERQLIELKAVDGAYPLYGSVRRSSPAHDHLHRKRSPATRRDLRRRRRADFAGPAASAGRRTCAHRHRRIIRVTAVLDERARPHRRRLQSRSACADVEGRACSAPASSPSAASSNTPIAWRCRRRASIERFNDDAKAAFPDSGWEIRDRNNAAPGIKRFVEQVTMFLTLVGLTALAVGGVGAGQAVSAFLDRKREEIATLKSLGAEGGLIFLVYFLQVMMIAVAAVIVGLILGARIAVPRRGILRRRHSRRRALRHLSRAAARSPRSSDFLSAAAFAIPPLARAREIMPASLFRDVVAPRPRARTPALSRRRGGCRRFASWRWHSRSRRRSCLRAGFWRAPPERSSCCG